ncbi:bacteriohemerythrin [Turneriella parva]|uniref:Hemerythrin-like metal-binding protein n=1 Tax=Turneriella parva (strain ATCC BAA-1111 / DSM 21527 / NCTC 11395 / H) TaxID=869212 RepID=I4B0M7_TURPD|nr:bacteriohemerythrin [Turneriella parva]AFM10834.1 hemerythrin-like metal-binding protein [Turneriella parva DSM 21527]
MIPLEWTIEYSTGIPKIDSQHAYLFELANRLSRSLASGRSDEILANIIQELNEYVTTHFAYEESVMQNAHYDALVQHQAMHQKMREQLGEYVVQLQNKTLSAQALSKFLETWLTQHILHEDMAYIPAVAASAGNG